MLARGAITAQSPRSGTWALWCCCCCCYCCCCCCCCDRFDSPTREQCCCTIDNDDCVRLAVVRVPLNARVVAVAVAWSSWQAAGLLIGCAVLNSRETAGPVVVHVCVVRDCAPDEFVHIASRFHVMRVRVSVYDRRRRAARRREAARTKVCAAA